MPLSSALSLFLCVAAAAAAVTKKRLKTKQTNEKSEEKVGTGVNAMKHVYVNNPYRLPCCSVGLLFTVVLFPFTFEFASHPKVDCHAACTGAGRHATRTHGGLNGRMFFELL